jgi:hypothetical protein
VREAVEVPEKEPWHNMSAAMRSRTLQASVAAYGAKMISGRKRQLGNRELLAQ